MIAELRTRCGCTQRIELPEPPPYMWEIQWPLRGQSPYEGDGNFDLNSEVTLEVRRFFLEEMRRPRLVADPIAYYLEGK